MQAVTERLDALSFYRVQLYKVHFMCKAVRKIWYQFTAVF